MRAKSLQSCPTLCNPMDYSPLDSSVPGILQARILEWVPCPPPGDLPDPGFQFVSLKSPELAGRFFTTSTSWDARNLVELRSNPDPGCLSTVNLPFFHINRDATSHPCELFKKDTGCCIGRVSQGAGIQEVLNQCTFPSFETP